MEELIYTIILFIYGLIIGSFLNVYIFRNNTDKKWYSGRSMCQSCGYTLAWFDLIPVFSYLFLRGKCRKCHSHISLQYPLVELFCGIGYALISICNGFGLKTILYCLAFSCLICISIIDFKTFEIPNGLNIIIFLLGIINLCFDYKNWMEYLIGFVCVSGFLFAVFIFTKGRGIGGGDIKLMAAAGLLLGYKNVILALVLGCIFGSIIHIARMKISKEDKVLAFGPYLSAGIFITMLYGSNIVNWYLGMFKTH